MCTPAALLVIDVQESFRHRPYWRDHHVPLFVERLQALIDGAEARKIPVLQIFTWRSPARSRWSRDTW
jgi:nicotinamidase-related amidase